MNSFFAKAGLALGLLLLFTPFLLIRAEESSIVTLKEESKGLRTQFKRFEPILRANALKNLKLAGERFMNFFKTQFRLRKEIFVEEWRAEKEEIRKSWQEIKPGRRTALIFESLREFIKDNLRQQDRE